MRGRPLRASPRSLVCALSLVALCAHRVAAQSGANVLVVANGSQPGSADLAGYYAQKRQIPAEQIVRLQTAAAEDVSRAAFELQIEKPIADWLNAHSAQDRILYIVLTKGIPLRIRATAGRTGRWRASTRS